MTTTADRCSPGSCAGLPSYLITSETTARLGETWQACTEHYNDVFDFLTRRDEMWGLASKLVVVAIADRGGTPDAMRSNGWRGI